MTLANDRRVPIELLSPSGEMAALVVPGLKVDVPFKAQYERMAIIAGGWYWMNNHAHILKPLRSSLEYFAALFESIDYRPWKSGAA